MDREASQKYLAQQVMSASPTKLVAMLLDRAVMLLHEAIEAIEAGDIQRRWRANNKATEIIAELWQALDRERGGEIAENLNRLYGFMTMHLVMVDAENSAQAARDVINLLEPLRRSWRELADNEHSNSDADRGTDDAAPVQVSVSA